jgi:hypothetical protein
MAMDYWLLDFSSAACQKVKTNCSNVTKRQRDLAKRVLVACELGGKVLMKLNFSD